MEDEARKLTIVCDSAIIAQFQVQTSLKECDVELQELHLATSEGCNHLAPLSSTQVPLIDRLRALPGHVERAVFEGAFHEGSLALGQMVSHFNEINVGVIMEGFVADRSYEDLDATSAPSRSLARQRGRHEDASEGTLEPGATSQRVGVMLFPSLDVLY